MIGRRMGLRYFLALLVSISVVLLFAALASACPNCKNGLASSDPHHQGVVAGYFYSILFMMSMPFLLIGTFSGYAYVLVRRARLGQHDDHQEGQQ